ncbi:hypothetical protein ACHAWC_009012 [Mediolabrus comicus]
MTQPQYTPPTTPLGIDTTNINPTDSFVNNNNNEQQQYIIITITDEEEGIEIPLPTTTVTTTTTNNNYDNDNAKTAPLTPNTETSSSDDSFDDNYELSSANNANATSSSSSLAWLLPWLSLDKRIKHTKRRGKSRIITLLTLTLIGISLVIGWCVYFIPSSKGNNNNDSNDTSKQGKLIERVGNDNFPTTVFPLVECQGDCDSDIDCIVGLICYQRSSSNESVPGCSGGELDESGTDYCVREEVLAEELLNGEELVGGENKEELVDDDDDYFDDDDDMTTDQQIPTTSTTIQQAPTISPYPTISTSPTNPSRDLFLLSGQSNMVGHTTSGQSIGGNEKYWDEILTILNQPDVVAKTTEAAAAEAGAGADMSDVWPEMYNLIYEMNYQNRRVAKSLTSGLYNMLLHNKNSNSNSSSSSNNLLTGLDVPLTNGKCSFMEAYEKNGKSKVDDVSAGTQEIAWDVNCGHVFGHELMFGRSLELELSGSGSDSDSGSNATTSTTGGSGLGYDKKEFELIKIARGGSALYEHWYPNHGLHWHLLRKTIIKRGNEGSASWKGFVWHQGSQAAWSERQYGEDRSQTYLGNLTGLVAEVRTLMFDNSNVNVWQCKEEIPVVIVQVGYWPADNNAGQRVRDAQAKLCNDDPRAVLVKTDDLSRFYHYDAVSFLITGRRIAYAYKEALESVVECPKSGTGVPSSSPSKEVSTQPTTVTVTAASPSKSSAPSTVRRVEEDTTDPI